MIRIDERYWPLVVFRFSGHVTVDDVDEYLLELEDMTVRAQPTASLALSDGLQSWEMTGLRKQAAWIKGHEKELRELSVGVALVLPSPFVRGMLKAALWLQPLPQPHRVCATPEEGLAWIVERFRERRVPAQVPSRLPPNL